MSAYSSFVKEMSQVELESCFVLFDQMVDEAFILTDVRLNILSSNAFATTLFASDSKTITQKNINQLLANPIISNQMPELGKSIRFESMTHFDLKSNLKLSVSVKALNVSGQSVFLFSLKNITLLRHLQEEVESINCALRKVVDTVDQEKNEIRETFAEYIGKTIRPLLPAVNQHCDRGSQPGSLCTKKLTYLSQMLGRSALEVSQGFSNLRTILTTTELRICTLVTSDFSHKEIAEMESVSMNTLKTHVKHIRKKLGISNQEGSLRFLLQAKHLPPAAPMTDGIVSASL